MLGVYNPKRKRMDLYPVEGGAVLGLHLTAVHGSGAAASASGGLEGMGMRERRDMVIADFGSKKKQKMERSRKANIVDVTAVAAAGDIAGALRTGSKATARKAGEADAAAAGAAGSGGAGLGTSAAKVEDALMRARVATLPPFDLSAPTPSRAYPLERIFTPTLYKLIAASAHAFTKAVQEAAASTVDSEAAPAAAVAGDGDAEAATAGRPAPGTVEEAVWRFGRDSEFVKDRLTRLAARVLGEAEGGGAEQEEEEEEEEEEEDEEEVSDTNVVDSSAALARKRKQAAARKAAKAGRAGGRRNKADDVPTFKKLCCLMYLKHLLALHRAPEELRYRRIPVRKPGAVKGDDADAAAEEEVTETRLAIPQLRFIPDPIVSVLLDTFTETRGDTRASRGLAGAALSAASGSASSAAAGAGGEGELPAVVYARTPALTDKLRAYAAVMTLAVDGYSTDVRSLARDMRIVPAKLSLAYKELGCTIKPVRAEGAGSGPAAAGADADAEEASGKGTRGAVESYSATLRVPLTFPALKLGRGK
jgi:hypothetical protein